MTAAPKRMPTRRRVKGALRAAQPARAAAADAEDFDEPATPPLRPNPSIEEPTTPGMFEGEPDEACGLPGRAKTPSSDLH